MNSMKKGFTIIETMLVLSVTGLLSVGIMVGWSVNINRQRYDDSVNTFKSDIQQIFSDVENPTNQNDRKIACTSNTRSLSLSEGGTGGHTGTSRGASDCILLGKFVVFEGNTLTQFDVIGRDINPQSDCVNSYGTRDACKDAIEALRATNFVIATGANGTANPPIVKNLEWRARAIPATESRGKFNFPRGFNDIDLGVQNSLNGHAVNGLMIIRSPLDGTVITMAIPVASPDSSSNQYNNSGFINNYRNAIINNSNSLILSHNRRIGFCVINGDTNVLVYGRNKVVTIGGSASSVEVAPLDGDNSRSCGALDAQGRVDIRGVL